MAKKPSSNDIAAPDFSIFKKIKTNDRWADANVDHTNYGFVDTGSYALNALASGDMFGGLPRNKFIMACGRKGTGKSYMAKNNFAKRLMDEGYYIYHYDTEGETTEEDLVEQNGYDRNRFTLIKEPSTVKEFFESVHGIIEQFEKLRGDKLDCPYRAAFVLDSQGQLSTTKVLTDASKGKAGTQDFSKAKELAAMYRSITNRCANLGFPMFITNHVYLDPSGAMFGNPEKVAGGEGAQFSASIIFSMYKKYEKPADTGEITGVVLQTTVIKSRMVKDKLSAPIYLDYRRGLNRYYGLHDWAEAAGLIEEFSASKFPGLSVPLEKNGQKTRKKCYVIKDPMKNPEDWIVCKATLVDTKANIGTILEPLNEYIKSEFKYRPPKLVLDENDEDLEIDEEIVEESNAKLRAKDAAELASKSEALGFDLSQPIDGCLVED